MNAITSRRWAIALVASLALNLFLGGMFVASWGIYGGPRHAPAANPFGMFWSRDSAGPPAGVMLRRMWNDHAEEFRPRVRDMRDARRRVSDLLAAEELDRDALIGALADLRANTLASQVAMHAALVELAGNLSVEERRQLADFGRRWHGHHGLRPDYGRGPGPAP